MGLERLDRWHDELAMKKQYFEQRKNWARRIAQEAKLTAPGDTATASFYNRTYKVEIGPRGGLNVYGVLPWQLPNGHTWFELTPKQRKRG